MELESNDTEPPLRAIRAFEAFAEHGSIAGAAAELNVTPSAVSHQLHVLETHVQTALTVRKGRALYLTDEGRDYYRSIHSAFTVLRTATRQAQERSMLTQLTIGVTGIFGSNWLLPRIGRFTDAHRDIGISVVYSMHGSYPSDSTDLSIRMGTGRWPGYQATRLLSGVLVPACTPAFARRYGPFRHARDIAQAPLVHDGNRARWAAWFAHAGVRTDRLTGPLLEDGQLTLAAVRAELGFGLMRAKIIERELADGVLVAPLDLTLDIGLDYYLCIRDDVPTGDAVSKLSKWLLSEVRQAG
ncbi:LysR family transcriptional regulator [Paraburkholderia sp. LEh10]|uniref:LysR substrate-binding domain-containing protein n=1 Tax=Paraburkholderia sp. LEh10 TaxID=2821353 RepID=UPI001AE3480C|nr:LysR substrate-binding domain-containing protein [Paraburkholderia sp. LEh10]MBP0593661.1 LysR family transcriptional regulator [Paraburkholderia sp. LEh10]